MIEMVFWALLSNGVMTERPSTLSECRAFELIWAHSKLSGKPLIADSNTGDRAVVIDCGCYPRRPEPTS